MIAPFITNGARHTMEWNRNMQRANQKSPGNSCRASRSPILVFMLIGLGTAALHYRHESIGLRTYLSDHMRREIPVNIIEPVFPGATQIDYCKTATGACHVRAPSGKVLGYLLCSSPYCDDIKGYAGPVPLVIALDTAGTIRSIVLLENNETGAFISRLERSEFFEKWKGLSTHAVADAHIDAVSGATMTSAAIIASVRKRCGLYAGSTAGSPRTKYSRMVLPFLFMLPGLFSMLFPGPLRKLRPLLLFSNVIILGFASGTLFSIALFKGWALHGIDFSSQWPLIMLFALDIILGLFTGKNLYCGYICPFGSAQELAGKIKRSWHTRLPHWLHVPLHYGRSVTLAAIFLVTFIYTGFDPSVAEPFSAFLFRSAPLSAFILAGILLIISVVRPRFWCIALCPTGLILDMLRIHRTQWTRSDNK